MIRRDDSKPSRSRAFTAMIIPLFLLAGCSGPTAEAPPQVAPAETPVEKPVVKKTRSKAFEADDPGYSGKSR